MGKGLLGPNGGSGGTIEGKFGEHCSGNDGTGGSKFGVGKGKVVSMSGIGGCAFAIRLIVSKDSQGGGGLMARGDVSLDGWVGTGGCEVKGGASDEELEGPMKDQPISADASPTALSPGYIVDFDPEEDKEDPEEDPADHPADG
ncbi:hypothetical protein Tco_0321363 [Tanacetum coccineum]